MIDRGRRELHGTKERWWSMEELIVYYHNKYKVINIYFAGQLMDYAYIVYEDNDD